ncbi:hypothetical protein PY092_15635 [Muricauda sp. 334s03]|uniref:Acetyl esterase/lipase n=1 Tax=Flagellimonas yonaguniensis TaxID=3031325 RepID=A0ABT5Y2H5_9FLAO|nr:hypothetical protein [[Muricauda] yonaguniensis]MDF0717595.1 hypothetical protein [[Muricauda] yonaguniensis]
MKITPKSFSKINLLLAIIGICCSSCSQDDGVLSVLESTEVVLQESTMDTIVYAVVDNHQIPIYLSIPEGCNNKNFPAVVVMHGSDGMWVDHDIASGKMSGQNNQWRELFDANCIVGAFVDSYSGRGVSTRTGKWATAPDNFKISSQFIRPKDAYAALEVLKKLKFNDGSNVIRAKDVGLLGFSDGASAVASTLYDTDNTPADWEWTQTFDGKEYGTSSGILAPQARPENGFAGGVFYYGGSGGYNYWGTSPCGDNALDGNIFVPYAPMLYQIPSEGYLSENTLCLVDILQQKGMPVELKLYEGVGHGFDFDGNNQSSLARINALQWFDEILHMED